ncbi:MAG TPA: ROK family transcriptional regulator [Kineosporiaceae bacterium]|nr:ROK family transcriptional regulator [Kineosporiaceae bacterium]
MTPAKPSLELLRSLTDEHVLRALMAEPRLTRAELALRTGISKPTVSESVRRLSEAGLVRDTGERTTGRGRVGTYYALAERGCALVVGIAPEGVVAEALDVHGDVRAREVVGVRRPARPDDVTAALTAAVRAVAGAAPPVRLATVSAADPVDRATGRLVHLPDAPFLLGELAPAQALAPFVAGPVAVDNDVNWAARAERTEAGDGDLEDFAYLHLGEGLGCAIVADGEVRRGATGLAGEIAHLVTRGPGGRAMAFTEVFAELELRREASTAVDVPAVLRAFSSDPDAPAAAVAGLVAALVALADPAVVVLGGDWGSRPEVVEAVRLCVDRLPRPVPIRAARVTQEPSLRGARGRALVDLRAAVVAELTPRPRP